MLQLIIALSSLVFLNSFAPKNEIRQDKSFTLVITNVKNTQSTIHIGFYGENTDFPTQKKHSFAKQFIPDKSGEITISWNDIPEGDYALAVYQDLNNSDKMETNLFGYPKEPFGFSNNFMSKVRAPKFKECKIHISNGSKHQINLIN